MRRNVSCISLYVVVLAGAISAAAQATSPVEPPSSQSPQNPGTQAPTVQGPHARPTDPKPPDMVCFGYGPKWSVQFVNGEARYLGINQPDQTLLGDFYWVPQDKAWEWHRANDLAPMNGSFDLSATIQKGACQDPVRKQTYPYSAQINLPQGDMVSGCCRKLRPGEAPVGTHGLQQTAPGSWNPQTGGQQPAPVPSQPGTSQPNAPKPQ